MAICTVTAAQTPSNQKSLGSAEPMLPGIQPWLILQRADIERQGLNDLGEILRQIPFFSGSAIGPRNNLRGDGRTSVALLGLGAARTLVLVDGRREISDNDFSTFPINLVGRVELWPPGHVPVGNGAIAGVINIVTRDHLEGGEVLVRYGESFDLDNISGPAVRAAADTDAATKHAAFIIGREQAPGISPTAPLSRAQWLLGAEYSERDAVTLLPSNTDSAAPGALATDSFSGAALDDDINLRALLPSSAVMVPADSALGQIPARRFNVFARGNYALNDVIEAYAAFRYTRRDAETRFFTAPGAAGTFTPILVDAGLTQHSHDVDSWQWHAGLSGGFGSRVSGWQWRSEVSWGRREQQQTFFRDFSITGVDQRRVVHASVQGPFAQVPAGTATLSAGFEHRREQFRQSQALPADVVSVPEVPRPVAGDYQVTATFVDTAIPLWRQENGQQALHWRGSVRLDNVSRDDLVVNWSSGLGWQLSDQLQLRTDYTENHREASAREVFVSSGTRFPRVIDPCAAVVVGLPDAPAPYANLSSEQQARCDRLGVPEGGVAALDREVRVEFGSNADLHTERSRYWQWGLVWQPAAESGLSVQLDYWRLRLADAIVAPGAQDILNGCVLQGVDSLCQRQVRFDNGIIERLDGRLLNLGRERSSGINGLLNHLYVGSLGRIESRLSVSYLIRRESDTGLGFSALDGNYVLNGANDTTQAIGERLGNGVYPHWRGWLATDWQRGPWTGTLSLSFQGQASERLRTIGTDAQPLETRLGTVSARWYLDLGLRYQWSSGTELAVGIGNVFDESPPPALSTTAPIGDVDAYRLGQRTWFTSLRQRF